MAQNQGANAGIAAGIGGGLAAGGATTAAATGGIGLVGILTAIAGAIVVIGAIIAAIAIPLAVVFSQQSTTSTSGSNSNVGARKSFQSGEIDIGIVLPNLGVITQKKASRSLVVMCFGNKSNDLEEFESQIKTGLLNDPTFGEFVKDIENVLKCYKNQQINWSLRFRLYSTKYVLSDTNIQRSLKDLLNKTFTLPNDFTLSTNLNYRMIAEIPRNVTEPPQPDLNLALETGETHIRVVVNNFAFFNLLSNNTRINISNIIKEFENNLLNERNIGKFISNLNLTYVYSDKTLYLSIAFNLTSFDFFVSPENVIKSLVFIGRQKIQLPLNSTYHFDMLFETIWFGFWTKSNMEEIAADFKGCSTKIADIFTGRYLENKCLQSSFLEIEMTTEMQEERFLQELKEIEPVKRIQKAVVTKTTASNKKINEDLIAINYLQFKDPLNPKVNKIARKQNIRDFLIEEKNDIQDFLVNKLNN